VEEIEAVMAGGAWPPGTALLCMRHGSCGMWLCCEYCGLFFTYDWFTNTAPVALLNMLAALRVVR
jgi:hypothetical protein